MFHGATTKQGNETVKPIYPIYLQEESIASLYNQMFEMPGQSLTVTRTEEETKTSEKHIGLVITFLQVLGIETKFRRENSDNSGYTEEEMRIVTSEDRIRFIRRNLSEQRLLYNLNSSLRKQRPFGSFVDFTGDMSFIVDGPHISEEATDKSSYP